MLTPNTIKLRRKISQAKRERHLVDMDMIGRMVLVSIIGLVVLVVSGIIYLIQ